MCHPVQGFFYGLMGHSSPESSPCQFVSPLRRLRIFYACLSISTFLASAQLGRIFWLRTDKPNRHGACPISLRLTVRGCRPAELGTGITCRPVDWAGISGKHSPLKRSHPEYAADSAILETIRQNAKTAKIRLEAIGATVTPQAVAALLRNPAALTPGPASCLLEFMEGELETHYLPANRATYEAVRAVVRKFRGWHGKARMPLEVFPVTQAQKFYRHLLTAKARGGEVATANKAVAWLSALYSRGVKQVLWAERDNPFDKIDKQKAVKRGKVRLTADEQRAVWGLDLDPAGWLWRARAVYLTQFYLRGERIGACLLLRWSDLYQQDTVVRYQAQKNGPLKQVPVRPELAAVLTQLGVRRTAKQVFVLPFLTNNYDKLSAEAQLSEIKAATSVVNKALKAVAALANIDKPLRSHAARHTFATVAGKVVGARAVQQFLGHTTLKMTETYLAELDTDELDSAGNAAFDSL